MGADVRRVAELLKGAPAWAAHVWAAFVSALQAERFRWSLWLPVTFAAGIGAYFLLTVEPPLWWGICAVILGLALLWRLRNHAGAVLAAALVMAALGFLAADLRTERVAAPALAKRTNAVEVTGRILRRSPDDGGTRVLMAVEEVDALPDGQTPARVRISWRGDWPDGVGAGDWVRVKAVLRPLPGQVAPGAFDFARYAYFRRIGALGFAIAPPEPIPPPRTAEPAEQLAVSLGRLRRTLAERFEEAMPQTAAAVATALITGERGGIAEADLEALRDSGLAHLLAISGLHMMLVGGLAFMVLRALLTLSERIALTRPVTKWAAFAAVPVAGAYLAVSGAPISAQRAFLMFSLMMIAILLDRRAISMRIVALTAFTVLALTPESLLEAGFQMSFAAVIALIAVYESQADRLARRRSAGGWLDRSIDGAWRFIAGISITTVIASTATAPFAAFHFHQSVLYALPANLAAMPLFMGLVMPFGLLGVALMPLGLEVAPLAVMGWGVDGILSIAHSVSNWPGAALTFAAVPGAALVLLTLGGLWFCLWTGSVRRLGIVPAALAFLLALAADRPDILIDEQGELMAVRNRDTGRYFLTRTSPRFVAENWLERDGDGRSVRATAKAIPENWRCDEQGCILRQGGRPWLAFVRNARALAYDCEKAEILVSQEPVRGPCERPGLVIGRFDLWRKGAHAIWLSADGRSVARVETTATVRPWSPYRTRLQRRERKVAQR